MGTREGVYQLMAKKYISLDVLPATLAEPLEVTSVATGNYNCIAWALENTSLFY